MKYTINKIAKLDGISTHALRHYDKLGLLSPVRMDSNSYRIYSQNEIDRLQLILFHCELGVPLEEINAILSSRGYDVLLDILPVLAAKRSPLDLLITNVEKSILAVNGKADMSNEEKFIGFKQKPVARNKLKHLKENSSS